VEPEFPSRLPPRTKFQSKEVSVLVPMKIERTTKARCGGAIEKTRTKRRGRDISHSMEYLELLEFQEQQQPPEDENQRSMGRRRKVTARTV